MPRDGATPAEREHRRLHRRGQPAKIDRDPEVRAFIEARIGELTYDRLAAEARAAFGVRRAPSRSAIQRWFIRRRVIQSGGRRDRRAGGCIWCGREFPALRRGPHDKRFCTDACRSEFHLSCRRYGARLFDLGLITADDLARVAKHASARRARRGNGI
jgi:hypothetical protein